MYDYYSKAGYNHNGMNTVPLADLITGKSMSEAFILTSTNPQNDKRLIIDWPVQYIKTTSLKHVVYINCPEFQNKNKKQQQFVYITCFEVVVFMYWNNLLSYCGLVDPRISASDKDLPVCNVNS